MNASASKQKLSAKSKSEMDEFRDLALKAMARMGRKVALENRRFGLPLIVEKPRRKRA